MLTVMCFMGTRPEAIKLSPVIDELRKRPDTIRVQVCVTGQHREMLEQVLQVFDIHPDIDLALMRPAQSLATLSASLFTGIDAALETVKPDWVLVQGDTTTGMIASLASFYRHIRVGHVEAGLRTYDSRHPFPEEVNRRIIALAASLHFAPTDDARDALTREGIDPTTIAMTGNTVIDALLGTVDRMGSVTPSGLLALEDELRRRRIVLVTGHRRENFGPGLRNICHALRNIALTCENTSVVYPVHLNPAVHLSVHEILGEQENIHLLAPLDYREFVWMMSRSTIILTDSGGVQEEAPTLGKPVLVMREKTERPEGIAAGNALLVGTGEADIIRAAVRLLSDTEQYMSMSKAGNPYGDGQAARRIVRRLVESS